MKIAQRIMLQGIYLWVIIFSINGSAAIDKTEKFQKILEPSSAMQSLNDQNKENSSSLEKDYYYLCRKALQVRTVRAEQKEDSCVTYYTKQGLDEEVLKAKDFKNCTPVVSKVKSNLEKGGWICKNISDSTISN